MAITKEIIANLLNAEETDTELLDEILKMDTGELKRILNLEDDEG